MFLPGWEEGLFPHQLALDQSGAAGLEEERRLAYVGLTRARLRAHVLFAANRHRHGQWVSAIPSRFVAELAPEHVMLSDGTGMQPAPGGLYRGHGGASAARRLMSEHAAYRSRRTPPVIDATPDTLSRAGQSPAATQSGARIFHQKFGYGRIQTVDGDKLEIAFEKAGTKKSSTASFSPPTASECPVGAPFDVAASRWPNDSHSPCSPSPEAKGNTVSTPSSSVCRGTRRTLRTKPWINGLSPTYHPVIVDLVVAERFFRERRIRIARK